MACAPGAGKLIDSANPMNSHEYTSVRWTLRRRPLWRSNAGYWNFTDATGCAAHLDQRVHHGQPVRRNGGFNLDASSMPFPTLPLALLVVAAVTKARAPRRNPWRLRSRTSTGTREAEWAEPGEYSVEMCVLVSMSLPGFAVTGELDFRGLTWNERAHAGLATS